MPGYEPPNLYDHRPPPIRQHQNQGQQQQRRTSSSPPCPFDGAPCRKGCGMFVVTNGIYGGCGIKVGADIQMAIYQKLTELVELLKKDNKDAPQT